MLFTLSILAAIKQHQTMFKETEINAQLDILFTPCRAFTWLLAEVLSGK